jgi:hypothetical protein
MKAALVSASFKPSGRSRTFPMISRTRAISLTSRLSLVLAVILYAYHAAHGAVEFLNLEFCRLQLPTARSRSDVERGTEHRCQVVGAAQIPKALVRVSPTRM